MWRYLLVFLALPAFASKLDPCVKRYVNTCRATICTISEEPNCPEKCIKRGKVQCRNPSKPDRAMCVYEMHQRCLNDNCLTSEALDCSQKCRSLAKKRCRR